MTTRQRDSRSGASPELSRRLEKHFLTCCAAAAAGFGTLSTANEADAGIIYSGTQLIPVPNTFGGVYFDFETGAFAGGTFPGWDLNPYYAGHRLYSNGNTAIAIDGGGVALDMLPGATVDGTLTYQGCCPPTVTPDGDAGYIGFVFDPDLNPAPETNYGWFLQYVDSATGGLIVEWAYNDMGLPITVGDTGVIPEPSTLALLAMGAAGLAAWRYRRSKAA